MPFKTLSTELSGPLLEPAVFGDDRGFFCRRSRRTSRSSASPRTSCRTTTTRSKKYGTVRGLHFQIGAGASSNTSCSVHLLVAAYAPGWKA